MREAVDGSGVAEHDSALERGDGVSSDGGCGRAEFDARELRGPLEEGVGRQLNAGQDRAADVITFGIDGIERCGGAEVDDNDRRLEAGQGGDGVRNAVGPDGVRWIVGDGQADIGAGG